MMGTPSRTGKKKDASVEDPNFEDLNRIGTVGQILKQLKMPDGSTTVIIQGKKRFKLNELVSDDPYIKAKLAHNTDKYNYLSIPEMRENTKNYINNEKKFKIGSYVYLSSGRNAFFIFENQI